MESKKHRVPVGSRMGGKSLAVKAENQRLHKKIESLRSDLTAMREKFELAEEWRRKWKDKCEGLEKALEAADKLKEHAYTVGGLKLGIFASNYSALRAAARSGPADSPIPHGTCVDDSKQCEVMVGQIVKGRRAPDRRCVHRFRHTGRCTGRDDGVEIGERRPTG